MTNNVNLIIKVEPLEINLVFKETSLTGVALVEYIGEQISEKMDDIVGQVEETFKRADLCEENIEIDWDRD
jgi:hypothetical protein